MKKVYKSFLLQVVHFCLLGMLFSTTLLLYLVVTNSYFEHLQFKIQGFEENAGVYLMFVFNIPMIILALYGVVCIINSGTKKLGTAISLLLSLVLFCILNLRIIQLTVFSPRIKLNLTALIIVYAFMIYVVGFLKKNLNKA